MAIDAMRDVHVAAAISVQPEWPKCQPYMRSGANAAIPAHLKYAGRALYIQAYRDEISRLR